MRVAASSAETLGGGTKDVQQCVSRAMRAERRGRLCFATARLRQRCLSKVGIVSESANTAIAHPGERRDGDFESVVQLLEGS